MADPAALVVANPDLTAAVVQISSFLSHLTVGGASAHLLEWAKSYSLVGKIWALLGKRGKTIVGGIVAGAGSLGVTATFQHDPHAAAGTFNVLLTGLYGPSILQHAWSFVQSFLLQQSWYMRVIKPQEVTGVEPKPLTSTGPGVEPAPVLVAVDRKP